MGAAQAAIEQAHNKGLRILPIGEGSNIVFAGDYEGLVLKNEITGVKVVDSSASTVTIEVGGGHNWHELVKHCLDNGWYGLENLALIPGTAGAAPVQNIGAYGVELSGVFESLCYLPINSPDEVSAIQHLNKAACQFGYRDSVLKHALRDKALITSIRLCLSTKAEVNISYPALLKWLQQNKLAPTPNNVFTSVCAIRNSKLPNPTDIPNAGSFFKNPVVSAPTFQQLRDRFNSMPSYPMPKGKTKLSAAWLIEQAGWKGRNSDQTGMHTEQALVLVNPAHADGRAVLDVAKQVAASVQEQFDVELEIEPRIYPTP